MFQKGGVVKVNDDIKGTGEGDDLHERPIVNRPVFQAVDVKGCHEYILHVAKRRLAEKGEGIYLSSHETLGIVTEEYHEFVKAVQDDNTGAQYEELVDIAVACLLGMASIENGGMHW